MKYSKLVKNPLSLVIFITLIILIFLFQSRVKNSYIIERGNIQSRLSVSGNLDAEKKAEFSFKTTGRVSEIDVTEGDSVEKGDVLAKLDSTELSLTLARARDDVRQAEAERAKVYDEVKDHDTDETFAQRETRTQAEVKYDKAVRNLESARKALEDSALYSPFSGVVIIQDLDINEWVSAFSLDPQIVIVDPSTIYFSAEVDQENIELVNLSQKAFISIDAFPYQKLQGEVYQIAQTIKQIDGGKIVEVKIKIDSPSNIVGLDGDAQILLEDKNNVLLLPKEAIFKKNGDDYVRTDSGDKKVKLGIFDGSQWEILDGLKENEKVVW